MEPVRNHRNPKVVEAARLHRAQERRARHQTLIEGPHLLESAIQAGAVVGDVFALESEAIEGALLVDERALARLADTKHPRGPVAVVQIPDQPDPTKAQNWLVSVGVSDPGNLGTLVRTAAAYEWVFGYMPGSADPWSPKSLRAGAGGQFQTAVIEIEKPPEWLTTVATVVSGGGALDAVVDRPLAVLIGEEAAGLPDDIAENADHRVTIATPGPTESLNAAVFAGIAVHELAKRSTESPQV